MVRNQYLSGTAPLIFLLASVASIPAQEGVAALVRDGKAKAERKEFKAAIGPLTEAIDRDSKNVEALRWRAHCRTALGLHAMALADLDAAIALDAKNAWVLYARGMAKHHLGKPREAIADYSKSLEIDPSNHKAVEWRGFNRNLVGDHLGAYLDFTNAMKLDPENPWVFFARGKAANSLGALHMAREDYRSAVLLDPKSAEAHAQLGYLHVATGDMKAAVASFDRAFQLDPKRMDYARLWRYWLRGRAGRLEANARDELPVKNWTGELARTLLGERTRAQLLNRLSAYGVAPGELPARKCEAAFYLGLRSLISRKPNRAREHFRDALVIGDASMPEWHAARRLAKGR